MKLKKIITVFTILISTLSFAQDKVETAEEIMDTAFEQAEEEDKNVLLMFHASWCGWCKKMDASINQESVKDMFESNYIITHLVVKETEKNKHLENPGAAELLSKHGGDKSGIPYWLILIVMENF